MLSQRKNTEGGEIDIKKNINILTSRFIFSTKQKNIKNIKNNQSTNYFLYFSSIAFLSLIFYSKFK